jgi:hypothetical protein
LGKCNIGKMTKYISQSYVKSIIFFGNPLFHRSTIPLFHDLGKGEGLKKYTVFSFRFKNVGMQN